MFRFPDQFIKLTIVMLKPEYFARELGQYWPGSLRQHVTSSHGIDQSWKLGQFPMLETCENCFDLVNRCIYYAHQTCEISQVLPYWVDLKSPGKP